MGYQPVELNSGSLWDLAQILNRAGNEREFKVALRAYFRSVSDEILLSKRNWPVKDLKSSYYVFWQAEYDRRFLLRPALGPEELLRPAGFVETEGLLRAV